MKDIRCITGYHYEKCPCAIALGIAEHSIPLDNPARFIKKYIFDTWRLPHGRAFKIGPVRHAQFGWAAWFDCGMYYWFGPFDWHTR